MSRALPGDVSVHRFFHAMVVMGGTVALGCGGVTSGRQENGTPPHPSSGGTGGTVTGFGGTSGFNTGGSSVLHAGGSTSTGGTSAMNTGGAGAATVGAPGCAPAQWDCGASRPSCSQSRMGVSLPTGCTCDTTRPLTAAACTPGQAYVCWAGVDDAGRSVPFQCSCVTAATDCFACDSVFSPVPGGMYNCDHVVHDGGVGDVLCGCAVVFLK